MTVSLIENRKQLADYVWDTGADETDETKSDDKMKSEKVVIRMYKNIYLFRR